jgi:hypothetical protein
MRKTLAILGLGAALVAGGCVTTGTITGRETNAGKPAGPIQMTWKSERFGFGGTISTALPTGEVFTGKYVQVTSETTADTVEPFFMGWGPYWGPDWGDATTFATNYSGKVIANLFGDRGDSMRCRFTLTDPDAGMEGGGVGECQVTGGIRIDAQF